MITIPSDATLVGELRGKGRWRIDGLVEGLGQVEGLVLVANGGTWRGDIYADEIVIEGLVVGTINANVRIRVGKKARILGDVNCENVSISSGASISGQVRMRKPDTVVALLESRKSTAVQAKLESAGDKTAEPDLALVN